MNSKKDLIRVTKLYYYHNLTQEEIADQVGISRIKVSRMLKKARDMGIITVVVNDTPNYEHVERTIKESFQLKNVMITDIHNHDVRGSLAQMAGSYLNTILEEGDTIAVGWGKTLQELTKYCYGNLNKKTLFTPLIGGHGDKNFNRHSNSIANQFAENYLAKSATILAPAFAQSQVAADMYMHDPNVLATIDRSSQANIAIFSIGNPNDEENNIISTGYLSEKETALIKESDTTSDIASIIFLNQEGKEILQELEERRISVSQKAFAQIDRKICIAGGRKKHISILSAIKSQYVDELITDIDTARFLTENI
ncbi:sugar-binding transcriptional regulator [Aerococcus urinae]|uniref:sugar-binding transcriptional regulator n=1 Tax=Aerococcus urinae TaxID=1376 RepID=UPI00254CBAC3|nr:sugar-binding domain-containing protein [Aerococcus urinae]MDK6450298.1 sugar-binding domain-containing protein [Aerococcus urinae]